MRAYVELIIFALFIRQSLTYNADIPPSDSESETNSGIAVPLGLHLQNPEPVHTDNDDAQSQASTAIEDGEEDASASGSDDEESSEGAMMNNPGARMGREPTSSDNLGRLPRVKVSM